MRPLFATGALFALSAAASAQITTIGAFTGAAQAGHVAVMSTLT